MKSFLVSEIVRPSITFEEVKSPDGSFTPGKSYWAAVEFVTEANINDVIGNHDYIELQWKENPKEVWAFRKATAMLHYNKEEPCRYVLTYAMVERKVGNINLDN